MQEELPFAYARAGQKEKAMELMNSFLAQLYENKDYFTISSFCHLCLINNRFVKEGYPWSKKAVELAEWKNGYPLSAYISMAEANEDYREAIRVSNLVLALPDSTVNISERDKLHANMRIAVLLIKSGNAEEGEKKLNKLLQENMNNKDNMWLLSFTCCKNKIKLKEALRWMEKAVEQSKEDENVSESYLNLYADLLFENKEIKKAIETGEEVCKKSNYYGYKDDLERYKAALKK